jgi:hypothetical protein
MWHWVDSEEDCTLRDEREKKVGEFAEAAFQEGREED